MRPSSASIRWIVVAVLAAVALTMLALLRDRAAEPPLVDDGASLVSDADRQRLAEYHAYLTTDHDIDYRIVTVAGVGDINRFAVKRFERLAATSRSQSGRGLLLVIDAAADLVRLEVSYALEGVYPDAFVAYVEHRQMVPFFARDRVADGILAATELVVTRAQRAAANAGFEDEIWSSLSGGGGATAAARLGAGSEAAPASRRTKSVPARRSPAETLQAYLAAMAARNDDPSLEIYTPETQRMLEDWVMTPAQMDNVAKTYRRCHPDAARVGPKGDLAVVRYPVDERECSPWFFRRMPDGWALDLTMMQKAIRFGRTNAWHFEPGVEHPYRFAFEDWRFDRRGFPVE